MSGVSKKRIILQKYKESARIKNPGQAIGPGAPEILQFGNLKIMYKFAPFNANFLNPDETSKI